MPHFMLDEGFDINRFNLGNEFRSWRALFNFKLPISKFIIKGSAQTV